MNTAALQEAEQFARELFRSKPHLGIDEAARLINDSCKRGLIKPTITAIRREVRQRLEAEALFDRSAQQKLGQPFTIRRKQVFNPIRVVVNPEPLKNVQSALESLAVKEGMEVQPKENPVAEPKHIEKPKPASAELKNSKLDRLKFLETWCLEHVQTATIESAKEALRQQFNGVAMGTKIVADTLRMAKQLYDEQAQKALKVVHQDPPPNAERHVIAPRAFASSLPIQYQVQSWVQAMKNAGVRLVEITNEGKVRVEFAELNDTKP